jgi:hypothetical protein
MICDHCGGDTEGEEYRKHPALRPHVVESWCLWCAIYAPSAPGREGDTPARAEASVLAAPPDHPYEV